MAANSTGAACDDNAFGPSIRGCRQSFDFTLAFEQYFFIIAPSVVLLLCAPLRLSSLRRFQPKVLGQSLQRSKLVSLAVFAVLQLCLVIFWSLQPTAPASRAGNVGAALCFVAGLTMIPMSYLEHNKSLKPSIILNAYLLLTLIFDAAILRTLWLSSFHLPIRALFTAQFIMKAVILILEGMEKRRYLKNEYAGRSPEEFSGLYGQSFLWWLNDIVLLGARQVLAPTDLYPVTANMSSKALDESFTRIWRTCYAVADTSADDGMRSQPTQSKAQKHLLPKALIRLLWWQILTPIFSRMSLIAFTFCQPLLLKRLLNYLGDSSERQNVKIGYGLIGAYGVVYLGIAISSATYWHQQYRFLTMVRGVLTTAVYRKAFDTSVDSLDSTKTVTLMSTDCERVARGLMDFHELWANIVQVGLATWLIERDLGIACVGPIALVLAATALTVYLSSFTTSFQLKWIDEIESRTGLTSSILGSMRGIKVTNLAAKALDMLNQARKDELSTAGGFRLLGVLTSSLAYFPQYLSPVVTFAIFVGLSRKLGTTLDTSTLFTSLSLLLLQAEPLFNMFAGILDFMSALGCVQRIQDFLLQDARLDKRHMMNHEESEGMAAKSALVTVRDGAFGWKKTETLTLQNLNFSVERGTFAMIRGPVGSGKSTLLSGLLGETPVLDGSVSLGTPNIAVCEQSPWLTNSTIRSNIIGFSVFDQSLYNAVCHACDLQPDFALLPLKDETIIGSKGFSISGGQKQRIALARAVYSKKDLLLLDDVFSQLDIHTRNKLADRLFGKSALFRTWRTTVIFASSSETILRYVDQILDLDRSGNLSVRVPGEVILKTEEDSIENLQDKLNETGSPGPSNLNSPTRSGNETKDGQSKSATSRQSGDVSAYRFFFASIRWEVLVFFLFIQLCLAFFTTFPSVWLKWWSDQSARKDVNGYYFGGYAGFQIAALLVSAAVTWWSFNVMALSSGYHLHSILATALMNTPYSLFGTVDIGSILTRFTQDIGLVDIQLPLSVQMVISNLLICIAQSGLIAAASAWIAVSYPVLLLVFYLVSKYYLRTSRQMRYLDLEGKAPVYAKFLETLDGMSTIRAFNWIQDSLNSNYQIVDGSQRAFYLMYLIQKWLSLVLDLIMAAVALLVVGIAIALRNTISPGFTGVSLTQIISFTTYLKMMILFWTQMETSIGAVTRIKEFSAGTNKEEPRSEGVSEPASWPSNGKIEVRNLNLSYSATSDKLALEDISLTIEAGEKVCICGRTGRKVISQQRVRMPTYHAISGKSSLVLALLRLVNPHSGNIKIDGIDLGSVSPDEVRSRLVGVAEQPFFFPGTVRQNMDPYGKSADGALVEALNDVHLWSIMAEQGGLDASMQPEDLSHGQKQLFGMARAIVRRHAGMVLILDEASSSLDREAEAEVRTAIRNRFGGHTVVSVLHKLESVTDFDKIAVIDRGRLIEYDTPERLMSSDSTFKEIYSSQQIEANVTGSKASI